MFNIKMDHLDIFWANFVEVVLAADPRQLNEDKDCSSDFCGWIVKVQHLNYLWT